MLRRQLRIVALVVCSLATVMVLLFTASADAFVYWTNSSSGSIGRANNDGSEVNENFITGASGPYGIAVSGSYLYWTNAGTSTIGRANLDGTSVNQSFIHSAGGKTQALAVDGVHIYWGDRDGSAIGRANLDGTGVNQNFIATYHPAGLAVNGSHLYWSNSSNSENIDPNEIGRANLGGTGVEQGFITTGSNTNGVAVDASYIYWANYYGNIGRANLDGTSVNEDLTNTVQAVGIAVSNSSIYWAEPYSDEIGRANLDGTGGGQFLFGSFPEGVAVDNGVLLECPPGQAGTPPNCNTPMCPAGQVGTPPNCNTPPSPPAPWYVALGDSFQSGEGAFLYEPGTGGKDGCHRSPDAYARSLQQALGVTTGFFACSGARIADILNRPPDNYNYNCDSGSLPFGKQPCKSGEDPQIQHLHSSTRLVTIGVGGNDIDFADIVKSCVLQTIHAPGTCEGKTDELNALLPAVAKELYRLYPKIAVAAPHARILVVDYPKIFPDNGKAGGNKCEHLNQEDQLWANDLVNHLDDWIAEAVRESGVAELVDVRNAFQGHGLCSSHPYVNHIWLDGSSVKPESFHPNAEGQASFFRFVLAQYKRKAAASARVNVLPGRTATKRVQVPHGTRVVTFSSRWPGSTVSMTLVSPSGRRYTRSTRGVGHASGPTFETYTINHPQPGSWKVRLHGTRVRKGGELVSLRVTPARTSPGALKRRGKHHVAA